MDILVDIWGDSYKKAQVLGKHLRLPLIHVVQLATDRVADPNDETITAEVIKQLDLMLQEYGLAAREDKKKCAKCGNTGRLYRPQTGSIGYIMNNYGNLDDGWLYVDCPCKFNRSGQ